MNKKSTRKINLHSSLLILLLLVGFTNGSKATKITQSWGWRIGKTVGLGVLGVFFPPAAIGVGLAVGLGEVAVSVGDADPDESGFVAADGLGRMAVGVGLSLIPGLGTATQLVAGTLVNGGITAAERVYKGEGLDGEEMVKEGLKDFATGALFAGISTATSATVSTAKGNASPVVSNPSTESYTKAQAAKAERAVSTLKTQQENAAQAQAARAQRGEATLRVQLEGAKHMDAAKAERAMMRLKGQQENAAKAQGMRAERGITTLMAQQEAAAHTRAVRSERAMMNEKYRGKKMTAEEIQKNMDKFYKGKENKNAADLYSEGVQFTEDGFPDFTPFAKKSVEIDFSGDRGKDVRQANRAAGYKKTPKGYTWHHHQDGHTLQLVPTDLHSAVRHTGGFSL